MLNSRRLLPALRLSASPLTLVLAQIKISPVLKMGDYVADIQDRLRKSGLPDFSTEQSTSISFRGNGPHIEGAVRWVLRSPEFTTAVILANDFIVYQTSSYRGFKGFLDGLRDVINVIQEIVEIDLATGHGLRYIDHLRLKQLGDLSMYLRPGMIGLRPEDLEHEGIDVSLLKHSFDTRFRTPYGTLAVQLHQPSDESLVPPDLTPTHLSIKRDISSEDVNLLLDFDHYSRRQVPFDIDASIGHLSELHQYTDMAFRKVVTRSALKLWGDNGVSDEEVAS